MNITEFGRLVRKARIDTGVNLGQMAEDLGVTAPFLSGLETGRKKISKEWAEKISEYFSLRGLQVRGFKEAADISNQEVSLEGLSPAHQMLVAGFARSSFNDDELKRVRDFFEKLNK